MQNNSARYEVALQGREYTLSLSGEWRTGATMPASAPLLATMDTSVASNTTLRLVAQDLGVWDSSLLVFLMPLLRAAHAQSVPCTMDDLPNGLARLLRLALAVPARAGAARSADTSCLRSRVGNFFLAMPARIRADLAFLGSVAIAVGRACRGGAQMRLSDLLQALRECGAASLPIVSITSLLFGLILAFVGAIQLTQFGAQIYVAGLVGIGVVRVMGAVMVGVVMAGRMGASYAASIGTMQVNEEIDALETLGIQPVEYLVLPRLIAMTAMTPILTLYADCMGLIGGYLVGITILGLHPLEYFNATMQMVGFKHVLVGLVYSVAFGIIVALAGCRQGLDCGRSASAVGLATTAAVVNAIVGIIVATALITIIFNVLQV